MSDFTNELLRLSEMRDKGLISQEEFDIAKAKLFGTSQPPAIDSVGPPEIPAAPTAVMSILPPALPKAPPVFVEAPVDPAPASAPSSVSNDIPPGIKGWSWGAFLWNWIWAIFNNTWIGLLALIPGVNLVMVFVLGAKGREWAWKNKRWDSVEHFNRVQRKWSLWGIWLTLGALVLGILIMVASFLFLGMAASKIPGALDANSILTAEPASQSNDVTEPVAEAPAAEVEEAATATDAATGDPEPLVSEDAATPMEQDTAANEQVDPATSAEQDAAAEQDRKHQQELEKKRAEVAAAKAEAAKAKKEALKAEKALADQQRREREEQDRIAQEQAEQEQMQCSYSKAQPLTCSSRKGQPTQCDWNFRACGNPRLAKKESKTSCEGKVSWDTDNNQLIVTDGCRAQFIPTR